LISALPWACGSEPRPTDGAELRARFPQHAARVLDGGEPLEASERGFALPSDASPGAPRPLEVTLPDEGGGLVQLRLSNGEAIGVRELGASGAGASLGRAVVYTRLAGTSFWTVTAGAVEHWLHLEAGAVRPGAPVASYRIEGARPEGAGAAARLVDGAGRALVTVTAPFGVTERGRALSLHLTASDDRLDLFVDDDVGDEAVLIDPSWVPTGSMTIARAQMGAALRADGQVLVLGDTGQPAGGTAELYDPALGAFGASIPATVVAGVARYNHTMTTLPDGRILVLGGGDSPQTGDLYDPATHSVGPAAPPLTPRNVHTATLLANGKVLVAGGYVGNAGTKATEIYDPSSDT
jgi:hypothetical protein